MSQHIVIIGGGFGGLYAAKRLKDAPVEVTLIDRRNHHLFQPLLYQVATGELSPADIASPLRGLLKHQKNARVLLGEVVDFDVANHEVILSDGSVHYDTLIVAAGAGNNYFGNEKWAQWAPSLKTIEDATDIRRRMLIAFEAAERANDPETVRSWLTFVIIGGGPTGVELAGALAEVAHETLKHDFRNINPSDARIILVQSGERILPMYQPELSSKAASALEELGVEVVTGRRVTDVGRKHVTLSSGDQKDEIAARTIVWAAGMKASPLGEALAKGTGAALDRSGRVEVQPDLSVPGHPNIFVIGDLANCSHQTGDPLPGVAQVAIQQGQYVGDLLKRKLKGKSVRPFHYRDRGSMATIGRGTAVAEIWRFRLGGLLAWQLWLAVHLMYQIEVQNRVLVFIQWVWNSLTRNRSAMLITNRQLSIQEERPLRVLETGTMTRV
jgi:NADH:ubiquinone reductase (H+-translocating)